MEDRISKLEKDIAAIQERNRRVEADKAWETSWARILSIIIITYIIAVLVMYLIGVSDYFLSALVPTIGFILSVQSLPVIKRWWIRKYLQKKLYDKLI